jgi:quercetin dioxygenase-like cupin family protein
MTLISDPLGEFASGEAHRAVRQKARYFNRFCASFGPKAAPGGKLMANIFNESTVAGETAGPGAQRQRLLTAARIASTRILLDRLSLIPGGTAALAIPAHSLAWLQMLDGAAVLAHGGVRQALSSTHVVLLPPGLSVSVSSEGGATLLIGEIPDAAALDPGFARNPPVLRSMDWTREPVLNSEHDARKRIYLVTPKLFATKAVKGEMIIYPPGTAAANHHHQGAEHFMYVLAGRGTVYANEAPFPVAKGDVIYYPDRERHYLEAAADAELVFAEFFAPAEFKTIWVDESQICTWKPTGRDIRGQTPVRDIAAHSSAEVASPVDV